MNKPTVLLVNDDGINAEGLSYLYHAVKEEVEPLVVAPASQQSGKGLSITLNQPIKSEDILWNGIIAHKVYGTPADCVKIALSILGHKPDFILSGINQGCNSGRNVLYSGTVGGIIEGVFRGIPGIAFSSREYYNPDYKIYTPYIKRILKHFIDEPIPKGRLMNVNFPKGDKNSIKGIRYATQGQGYWIERHKETSDNHHHFDAKWQHHEEHEHSDVFLLKNGYVTVSPLNVSHLTDTEHFSLNFETFNKKFLSK